jgi:bacterioferritin-associated ferredoxin
VDAVGVDRHQHQSGLFDGARAGVRAWGIFGDGTVALSTRRGTRRLTPRAIAVATGATDLPLPLPGWHRAGVHGAFAGARELPAGTRVVVLRGPHAGLAGRHPDLDHLDVDADLDLATAGAVSIDGGDKVTAVTINGDAIPTDHVLLDNGLQPENVLARMAGMPTVFSADAGGDAIERGSVVALQGSLLTVIGDAAGIAVDQSAETATAHRAGEQLAEVILGGPIPVSIGEPRPRWLEGGAPVLPAQVTDDTLICPDEGVTVGAVREAIARGATTVNDVKRRTRAAMATCQGRDCLWSIRALLADAGRSWQAPMTARPPATGITIAELAGLVEDHR